MSTAMSLYDEEPGKKGGVVNFRARRKDGLTEVNIADLQADTYQRWTPEYTPRGKKRAAKMAATYNKLLDEPPTVSVRADGSHWIIDGKHRVEMHALLGAKKITVRLIYNLTRQEEADLFAELNDRATKKPVSPVDEFRARVEAGRPPQVEVDRILRRHGLLAGGRIHCVRILERIYDRGPIVLEETVRIANHAVPTGRIPQWLVGGLGLLISERDAEIDVKRLREVVRRNIDEIEVDKKRRGARDGGGHTKYTHGGTSNAIIYYYNHGKRGKRLAYL